MLKVVSFFSGAGGLDLGFKKAGFNIIWANEYDPSIHPTFERNFPDTELDTRSIVDIDPEEVPDCDGIIGGPPCQSWSVAGARRGIEDSRGQLFVNYVNIIKEKRPNFFLAENVPGLLNRRNLESMNNIFSPLTDIGYNVSFKLLDANDYGVPQNRKRVIVVGYPEDFAKFFIPPEPDEIKPTLEDAIKHLEGKEVPAKGKDHHNPEVKIPNHEYMKGRKFSSHYMSRNRVRSWNKPSYTIQAGGRHAPCHPQAPLMLKTNEKDVFKFKEGQINYDVSRYL
jgi:DNA (cytosine-5)-methyltransferase 1